MPDNATTAQHDLFRRVAHLLAVLDLLYFALIAFCSGGVPWTLGLAVALPALNVPCVKLSATTGKPYIVWSLAFSVVTMFLLCWLSEPHVPAWIMGFSAVMAATVMIQVQWQKRSISLAFVAAAISGIYLAGASTTNLATAFVALTAFLIISQRIVSLFGDQYATLARSEQALARSNRDLQQFAHAASHDLKSPLRAIGNLADWIQEDLGEHPVPPEVNSNLTLLRSRVIRMSALIEGLLSYSRLDSEPSSMHSVDVESLVRDIATTDLPPTGQFHIEVGADIPMAVGNQTALRQVFANLIGNAVKHHDRAEGRIEVDGRETGTGMIEFTIRDDGPGIDPQYHEQIFRMFQTLRRRDELESTGMGLSLAQKLVTNVGGTIWLTAEPGDPGRGAEFRFTWPSAGASAAMRQAA